MTATTSPLPKGTRVRVHSGLLTAPLECHVIAILKPLPPKQRTHPNASTTRETPSNVGLEPIETAAGPAGEFVRIGRAGGGAEGERLRVRYRAGLYADSEKGVRWNTSKAFLRGIKNRANLTVLTGAGISTESGIPDFRSPGGVWSRMKPIYFDEFLLSEEKRREDVERGRRLRTSRGEDG